LYKSRSEFGIFIKEAYKNQIVGNYITDEVGANPLPNMGTGVFLEKASGNLIEGGNRIGFSEKSRIYLKK